MKDLVEGLIFAHKKKIFHNDINEQNCFSIENEKKEIMFKLGDWGSVRRFVAFEQYKI